MNWQVYFNVEPSDRPVQAVLSSDHGEIVSVTGQQHVELTCPDSMPQGWGGNLHVSCDGYQPTSYRVNAKAPALFLEDGSQLAVVLVPNVPVVPPLQGLHADGWDIRLDDGTRYVSNDVTNYLQFQRFLEGQDISHAFYPGFDGDNVTFLMSVVPAQAGFRPLTPAAYGAQTFYDGVAAFFAMKQARGRRTEATLLCDCDQLGFDHAAQAQHVERMYDLLRPFGTTNKVQLANEPEKNGVDYTSFAQPAGLFWSRGSSLAGGPCPLPAGNYSTAHLSRSSGGDYLDAQPFYIVNGYDGYQGTHGPVCTNETRGASDTENSGRRTTDPKYFRRIASAMRGWSGGTFHPEFGIHSDPMVPGSVQDACRLGWLEGIGAM